MLFAPKPANLLRRLLLLCLLCNSTVFLICIFLGLLLYHQPFLLLEDVQTIFFLLLIGTTIAAGIFLLDRDLRLLEVILLKQTGNNGNSLVWASLICLASLGSCEIKTGDSPQVKSVTQGSLTSPATGLKTAYRNIETNSVKLVMNDEVLGHTDIPLGEKFYIINEGVKGLTEKEGKVSVGCSLVITDETGKTIMNEPDLFSGNDLFNKDEVSYLRCAVSTGLPMESESYYLVKAKFWDKYGDGFIENNVKIRVIDMP